MSDKLPACRDFRQRATQEDSDKLEACRTFSEEKIKICLARHFCYHHWRLHWNSAQRRSPPLQAPRRRMNGGAKKAEDFL